MRKSTPRRRGVLRACRKCSIERVGDIPLTKSGPRGARQSGAANHGAGSERLCGAFGRMKVGRRGAGYESSRSSIRVMSLDYENPTSAPRTGLRFCLVALIGSVAMFIAWCAADFVLVARTVAHSRFRLAPVPAPDCCWIWEGCVLASRGTRLSDCVFHCRRSGSKYRCRSVGSVLRRPVPFLHRRHALRRWNHPPPEARAVVID